MGPESPKVLRAEIHVLVGMKEKWSDTYCGKRLLRREKEDV